MKNDFQDRVLETAKVSEQNRNSLDAARIMFKQITVEARRQAAIEQKAGQHRSWLVKILLGLTLVSCLSAAATGVYGIYNFPDAPLRQKGEVYTGKHGQPRTKEDFEKFTIWKNTLFAAFGSVFLLGFSFAVLDAIEKHHHRKLPE